MRDHSIRRALSPLQIAPEAGWGLCESSPSGYAISCSPAISGFGQSSLASSWISTTSAWSRWRRSTRSHAARSEGIEADSKFLRRGERKRRLLRKGRERVPRWAPRHSVLDRLSSRLPGRRYRERRRREGTIAIATTTKPSASIATTFSKKSRLRPKSVASARWRRFPSARREQCGTLIHRSGEPCAEQRFCPQDRLGLPAAQSQWSELAANGMRIMSMVDTSSVVGLSPRVWMEIPSGSWLTSR